MPQQQFAVININHQGKLVMKVERAWDMPKAVEQRIRDLPGTEHKIIMVSNAFPSPWGAGGVQFHSVTVRPVIPKPPLEIKVGSYVSQDDLERHLGQGLSDPSDYSGGF